MNNDRENVQEVVRKKLNPFAKDMDPKYRKVWEEVNSLYKGSRGVLAATADKYMEERAKEGSPIKYQCSYDRASKVKTGRIIDWSVLNILFHELESQRNVKNKLLNLVK